jgi:hypothetical protein
MDEHIINSQSWGRLRLSATLDNGTVWFVEESRLKEALHQCGCLDRWIALQSKRECSPSYWQDLQELQEVVRDIRNVLC